MRASWLVVLLRPALRPWRYRLRRPSRTAWLGIAPKPALLPGPRNRQLPRSGLDERDTAASYLHTGLPHAPLIAVPVVHWLRRAFAVDRALVLAADPFGVVSPVPYRVHHRTSLNAGLPASPSLRRHPALHRLRVLGPRENAVVAVQPRRNLAEVGRGRRVEIGRVRVERHRTDAVLLLQFPQMMQRVRHNRLAGHQVGQWQRENVVRHMPGDRRAP